MQQWLVFIAFSHGKRNSYGLHLKRVRTLKSERKVKFVGSLDNLQLMPPSRAQKNVSMFQETASDENHQNEYRSCLLSLFNRQAKETFTTGNETLKGRPVLLRKKRKRNGTRFNPPALRKMPSLLPTSFSGHGNSTTFNEFF